MPPRPLLTHTRAPAQPSSLPLRLCEWSASLVFSDRFGCSFMFIYAALARERDNRITKHTNTEALETRSQVWVSSGMLCTPRLHQMLAMAVYADTNWMRWCASAERHPRLQFLLTLALLDSCGLLAAPVPAPPPPPSPAAPAAFLRSLFTFFRCLSSVLLFVSLYCL